MGSNQLWTWDFGSPNPYGAEQDYKVLAGGAHDVGADRVSTECCAVFNGAYRSTGRRHQPELRRSACATGSEVDRKGDRALARCPVAAHWPKTATARRRNGNAKRHGPDDGGSCDHRIRPGGYRERGHARASRDRHGPLQRYGRDAGFSGPWRLNGGSRFAATPKVRVKNAHVRICFNFWGPGTKKGFHVDLELTDRYFIQDIWSARYWGPKNKTCSPWTPKATGAVRVILSYRPGVYGGIWLHRY
ncbi:hypothetical protein [Actinomadura nitritigenes]|uniref:hypothetical protein n=1 Tax=Actinomadura nitritigenes TaxID=134602 RepID=UPI003D9360E9